MSYENLEPMCEDDGVPMEEFEDAEGVGWECPQCHWIVMRRQAEEQPKAEHCIVCGSKSVVYHNYIEQPFCGPCADGRHRGSIDTVRVVVKLRDGQGEMDYVTFDLDLMGAPVPQANVDVIHIGPYQFRIRERHYHVTSDRARPKIVLHVGITNRRPGDIVTADALTRNLKIYPTVAL